MKFVACDISACLRASISARLHAQCLVANTGSSFSRKRRSKSALCRAPMTGYPRPSNLYPHAPHLPPDHGPFQRTSHCHSPPTCRIKRDRRSEAPLSRLKSRRFVVRVNHCASVIAICGAFWPSQPPNPTRYQKRRGYFVQTNIVSFQSRITNDLIKPSRINGSCLANSSAASRVLKIPMLPRSANGPMPITSPLALNASTTAL